MTPPGAGSRAQDFVRRHADGRGDIPERRAVPVEAPVAFEFDGLAYAVMMATPADLADFAVGFAIAERLTPRHAPIREVDAAQTPLGYIVRARLSPDEAPASVLERSRRRVAESGCGLCGVESLERLARVLPTVSRPLAPSPEAVGAALEALATHQSLGRSTGGTHAAAIADVTGRLLIVREDVGRHNALDKAIGARARVALDGDHLAIVTSRCSYELVEKAATAGLGALVAPSAPTTLAIDRARSVGLPLYVLARGGSVLCLS
ncbi:formate dehydrogenase accessory sulfurtransferase FdhD [Acuticoccus sp.]|uniref:formate dehydrogenase accessory sulfurtransferase FdhD n=1 Tax=Acuticoccus sp. TaxID=1904378 RepID=UPI003B51D5C2